MTNGSKNSFNMESIHDAIEIHFKLIELGYAPHCPHLTVFCELMAPHRILYETWLDLDMTYIELADVVYRLPGESKGADEEVAFAISKHIPVVRSLVELEHYFSLPRKVYA
jgi:hypothetical protein